MDNEINFNIYNNSMTILNKLPEVDSFFGTLDLKTGSMIISALCVLHPTLYGCTFFMPISYLLLTIWFLLALFFTTSVLLFYGLTNNDILLISTWIWYTLIFVATMFLLMFLLGLFFISKQEKFKAFIVFLGILWYMLTIYFILVVNSHRRVLFDATLISKTGSSDSIPDLPSPDNPSPDNPSPDNPSPDNPSPDKPSPDNPLPDNPKIDSDGGDDIIDESQSENEKNSAKDRMKALRKASEINNRRP